MGWEEIVGDRGEMTASWTKVIVWQLVRRGQLLDVFQSKAVSLADELSTDIKERMRVRMTPRL